MTGRTEERAQRTNEGAGRGGIWHIGGAKYCSSVHTVFFLLSCLSPFLWCVLFSEWRQVASAIKGKNNQGKKRKGKKQKPSKPIPSPPHILIGRENTQPASQRESRVTRTTRGGRSTRLNSTRLHHAFQGPLAHHYLYVSGPLTSTPVSPDTPSSADSSAIFSPKNNRSAGITSMLHKIRVCVLGEKETTKKMILFRQLQERAWRMYKLLMHRILKTGELERMITDSEITLVPMGNCINERVGFHPHLISLSVRISAYLRASQQLSSVLALEAQSNAAEMVAASAARSSPSKESAGGSATDSDTPGDGDEDPTPMSTPSLTSAIDSDLALPTFNLGPTARTVPIQVCTPPRTLKFPSIVGGKLSSSLGSAASSVLGRLGQSTATFASLAAASNESPYAHLPHPPALSLAGSDENATLVSQDKRANHLLQLIVAVKGVSRTSATYSNLFRPVLYRALIYRNELEDFLHFQLEPVLALKYDESNPVHESWLQELWSLYLPLGPSKSAPTARISQDWTSLGFQGENPASDFRGMGVLGLRNLMEFARLCPIQSNLIMRHSQEFGPLAWFSYAITGINLTADLVHMLQSHALDAYFFTYGSNWHTWHSLYATMFVKFDEAWSEKKPENIMAYREVHTEFLRQFTAEAQCFPFSPRSLASANFSMTDITPVTPRIIGSEGPEDEEEDFEIEDIQHVTEGVVSRRRSGGSSNSWTLSRSASPFSVSGGSSALSHPSSPNSEKNSPGLHALSRSEFLESGGILPLGSMLDPIVPPALFARHPFTFTTKTN